jgi:hypothetical protein
MELRILLVAALGLLAPGPAGAARAAEAGDLYARIADAYMMGRFDELDEALREAGKRMGELTAEQKAGVLYVRKALAECRPAWWALSKKGRKTPVRQKLWGKTLYATYDPAGKGGFQLSPGQLGTVITVSWKPEEMDSTAKGMYGYLQGDMTCVNVWSNLAMAAVWNKLSQQALARTSERDKLRLNRYVSFRANLATLYHCTPPGRRYALHIYFASFFYDNWGKSPLAGSRRAVCAMAMGEILADPSRYRSLKLPKSLRADGAEEALGQHYKHAIKRTAAWTLAEDRRFRESLKPFAAANDHGVYKAEKVTLPNKLVFAIDVDADKAYRPQRDAWVKRQFDKAKGIGK